MLGRRRSREIARQAREWGRRGEFLQGQAVLDHVRYYKSFKKCW